MMMINTTMVINEKKMLSYFSVKSPLEKAWTYEHL